MLAAASRAAVNFRIDKALYWSSLLRERALTQACPLLAIARDPSKSLSERVVSSAAAAGAWADLEAAALCKDLMDSAGQERTELLTVISRLAPWLAADLGPFSGVDEALGESASTFA